MILTQINPNKVLIKAIQEDVSPDKMSILLKTPILPFIAAAAKAKKTPCLDKSTLYSA
jgi:hypothetical protein